MQDEFNQGEYSMIFLGSDFQYGWSRYRTAKSGNYNNVHRGAYSKEYAPSNEEIMFGKAIVDTYEATGYPVRNGRIDFIKAQTGPLLSEAEFINPMLLSCHDSRDEPYALRFAKYFIGQANNQYE